jgi:hypothetical protein
MKKIIIIALFNWVCTCTFGQVYQNVTLPSSYPIVLEVASELSSDDLTEGKSIKLSVKYSVVIDGATVIRARAIAIGKIKSIKEATFNFPAFVTIEATNVQTVDDRRIDIHGEASFKGAFKGESATVKYGEIVEAITDTNVSIRGVRQ